MAFSKVFGGVVIMWVALAMLFTIACGGEDVRNVELEQQIKRLESAQKVSAEFCVEGEGSTNCVLRFADKVGVTVHTQDALDSELAQATKRASVNADGIQRKTTELERNLADAKRTVESLDEHLADANSTIVRLTNDNMALEQGMSALREDVKVADSRVETANERTAEAEKRLLSLAESYRDDLEEYGSMFSEDNYEATKSMTGGDRATKINSIVNRLETLRIHYGLSYGF